MIKIEWNWKDVSLQNDTKAKESNAMDAWNIFDDPSNLKQIHFI